MEIATSAASRPRAITMRPMRGMVVSRIERIPPAVEIDLEPGARSPSAPDRSARRCRRDSRCNSAPECSSRGTARRRDGHSRGRRRRPRAGRREAMRRGFASLIVEADAVMREIADRLHEPRARRRCRRTGTRRSRTACRCRNSGSRAGTAACRWADPSPGSAEHPAASSSGSPLSRMMKSLVKVIGPAGASTRVTRLPNRSI